MTRRSPPLRPPSRPPAQPRHWLLKTEPDEFSIGDLERAGSEPWSGVRNYQARNFLRDGMRSGDGVLIYHSSCAEPGVVGVAHVASPPRPDPTQFDPRSEYHDGASREDAPRWWLVDIAHDRTLRRTIPLAELHRVPALAGCGLLRRGNRLSVLPLTAREWRAILARE
ncbi:MAG: EVE domain-containing protein [Lysobacterales bacterium]